jgi:aspartyl-tRNA(Asn)/glutamyl-tRNA(Gln) amidotransferase subunit B
VELAAVMSFAVGCRVHPTSVFARKNYFYPDLPKGYQISQYDRPLAEDGSVAIRLDDASEKSIGIERIHMEEDAGKLLHEGFADAAKKSGVDFNRSGVPLIEIVSRPELSSPEEAIAYARALKEILEYTGVSDADMEKGNFRCDGNVSVRPRGDTKLGTKVELKNLNSFRYLGRALSYEVSRQIERLESGKPVVQETRLYDVDGDKTIAMRTKEEEQDYRYFPEPDLPPLRLNDQRLLSFRAAVPELPAAKRARFETEYELPAYDVEVLTSSRSLSEFFERAVAVSRNAKATSNWVMSEVLRKLKEQGLESVADLPFAPEALGKLVGLIDRGTISGKIAKGVFEKMFESGDGPGKIIERDGLSQISDRGAIEAIVSEIVAAHPEQVAEFQAGKEKVLGYLVGQIMKASKGQANPRLAREILVERLRR